MSKIQITFLIVIVTAVAVILFLSPSDQNNQTTYYPQEDQMSLVTISTSAGDIHLELDAENAPITVANFLQLAKDGYYNGTIFHRIIDGFMVQGGGLDENMAPKPTGTEPIQNEANNGVKNLKWSLSMARTNEPHSASSQFFINLQNNVSLDHTEETIQGWGYAVFGEVVDGFETIEAIAATETGSVSFHQDVPLEEISIIDTVVSSE